MIFLFLHQFQSGHHCVPAWLSLKHLSGLHTVYQCMYTSTYSMNHTQLISLKWTIKVSPQLLKHLFFPLQFINTFIVNYHYIIIFASQSVNSVVGLLPIKRFDGGKCLWNVSSSNNNPSSWLLSFPLQSEHTPHTFHPVSHLQHFANHRVPFLILVLTCRC